METANDLFRDLCVQGLFQGIVMQKSPGDPRSVLLTRPQHIRGESAEVQELREQLLANLHAFAACYHAPIVLIMAGNNENPPDAYASTWGQVQCVVRFMLVAEEYRHWAARLERFVPEAERRAFGLSLRTTLGFVALDAYWASPFSRALTNTAVGSPTG